MWNERALWETTNSGRSKTITGRFRIGDMADQHPYDSLDIAALTSLLLNPDRPADVHRSALSALSRRSAFDRTSSLVSLLKSMVNNPGRYDQDVMMALIDILATDPTPAATEAMLEALPAVLGSAMDSGDALKREFREYFYTALVTRQREGDLQVWAESLPELDAKTLVAATVDPAAGALTELDPLTLIDRLDEPHRTKALISVIAGVAHRHGSVDYLDSAVQMLKRASAVDQLNDGLEVLGQQWEKSKKAGRGNQAGLLEAALRSLDTRPRSASERITGKRPWAP